MRQHCDKPQSKDFQQSECSAVVLATSLLSNLYAEELREMANAESSSTSASSSSSPMPIVLPLQQKPTSATALVRSTGQSIPEQDMYGSRARVLKAAHLCCRRQGLLTVVGLDQTAYMLCEIHHYPQNDVCVMMKNSLNENNYSEFLQLVWGSKIAGSVNF